MKSIKFKRLDYKIKKLLNRIKDRDKEGSKMYVKLLKAIGQIGNRMINCKHKCSGILLDRNKGVLPRCLFIDNEKSPNKSGLVIVGINPGTSSEKEKRHYIKRSYADTVNYWKDNLCEQHPYYKKLRALANKVGLKGTILWTELVKCENLIKGKLPPLQTFRTCAKTHLNQELNIIPMDWPIIAVSYQAYVALSYLYPKRSIIGIPHPTGSYGHFTDLMKKLKLYKPHIKAALRKHHSIWLSKELLKTKD